ncbi:hypothetical protein ABZ532_06715 [Streptomyces sp. NPDC019396]|uniref:hypothetical protein n=1 Tax=Streptomyces sp. NPDC019396 TaxID=3154687 RepID=UPI0033EF625F
MELAEEIAAAREGRGDPGRLLGEFRRAAVLVPVVDGGLMSGRHGGIRWIHAFTDESALARFAQARDGGPRTGGGTAEWEYLSILGARLLDAVIPALDGPTGVAVNTADEDGSMLFPPVSGIVPDAVAVDTAEAAR